MYLPSEVKKILEVFDKNNIEAYTVGGSVRDALLSKNPQDFDITTSATPQEVIELFSDRKVIETGIKHGTVTVIMDSLPVEITTYRSEGEYSDHRHPDKVTFSLSLKEDLARRDFTINAICYCPKKGYFDPFDGQKDLKAKIIRTVGDPEKRFFEDALRILRALRFSATLGFEIEEKTEKAIFSEAELLKTVSKERVFAEFKRLIMGDNAPNVLKKYLKVFTPALTTLKPYEAKNIDFPYIKNNRNLPLCFAVFFLLLDKENSLSLAQSTLNTLKSDNKTKTEVLNLITFYEKGSLFSDVDIKRTLGAISAETTLNLVGLFDALGDISKKEHQQLSFKINQIIEKGECFKISQLEIDGKDILNLGAKPEATGKILNQLLEGVITGNCRNNDKSLLEEALKYIEKEDVL